MSTRDQAVYSDRSLSVGQLKTDEKTHRLMAIRIRTRL